MAYLPLGLETPRRVVRLTTSTTLEQGNANDNDLPIRSVVDIRPPVPLSIKDYHHR